MLKLDAPEVKSIDEAQPPSGGCVLKQIDDNKYGHDYEPAAFRRLCVETLTNETPLFGHVTQPPSGGCVLKHLG